MVVNKGENIGLTLQLIQSDGSSVETGATVTYQIFNSGATVVLVSGTATYNTITQSYIDTIVPSVSWPTQTIGSYLIVWSVSGTTDEFAPTYTEDLQIAIDEDQLDTIETNTDNIENKVDVLVTDSTSVNAKLDIIDTNVDTVLTNTVNIENKVDIIDTNVDEISDDVKIILGLVHQNMLIDQTVYDTFGNLESARVRIYSNSASVGTSTNVIATYQITSSSTELGKFTTWQQIKV